MDFVAIYHPETGGHAEVPPTAVPVWLVLGWRLVDGPDEQPTTVDSEPSEDDAPQPEED